MGKTGGKFPPLPASKAEPRPDLPKRLTMKMAKPSKPPVPKVAKAAPAVPKFNPHEQGYTTIGKPRRA